MRLTNKNQILEGFDGYELIKKLSDLEDIEEEFGIDLVALLNARYFFLKEENGIYQIDFGKDEGQEVYIDFVNKLIHIATYWGSDYMAEDKIYFKDYSKTWAFTKEELL